LRSVVDSCSSESNNDSDCDLESTDSEWIDTFDLRIEQLGVDNDDDIDSGYYHWTSILASLERKKVDNVEQGFC